nr:hypothetical protein [Rhizohabitans arisaemae]
MSTTAIMPSGKIHASGADLGWDARSAHQTAYAHHSDHPMCMLGIAEYVLDIAGSVALLVAAVAAV